MWLESEHYIIDKEGNSNLGQKDTYVRSNILLNINYIESFYESTLSIDNRQVPVIVCNTSDASYSLITTFETIKKLINGLS